LDLDFPEDLHFLYTTVPPIQDTYKAYTMYKIINFKRKRTIIATHKNGTKTYNNKNGF
jgi:hypothetical protein